MWPNVTKLLISERGKADPAGAAVGGDEMLVVEGGGP